MQVLDLNINDLKMYERNPRKNDKAVQYVAESIREFGFKVPIVVDADNVIIAGHTRLKAARYLGLDAVPCVVADDLTEEQVKAFRLADNKLGEIAEWDFDLLDAELAEIVDLDMSEFGFNISFDDLDIEDSDFITDTEITKSKEKKIKCPHCGEEFEA